MIEKLKKKTIATMIIISIAFTAYYVGYSKGQSDSYKKQNDHIVTPKWMKK